MQETHVQSHGQEDPLEKGMAAHSSTLARRIPWTRGWWATVHSVTESDTTQRVNNSNSRRHKCSDHLWGGMEWRFDSCFPWKLQGREALWPWMQLIGSSRWEWDETVEWSLYTRDPAKLKSITEQTKRWRVQMVWRGNSKRRARNIFPVNNASFWRLGC